jgi:RNA polymerase sigma-70 factor (ECF subfamily)
MEVNDIVRELIHDRAKLLGYVWAIVRDYQLADDVLQEVTVLALERASEITDGKHLLLWSRKAARYKSLELLRKRSRDVALLADDVLELLEADWQTLDSHSTTDEVDHLRACIDLLSPHARKIVHLKYMEGLSGAQVAQVIKVKVTSVYVALTRIHKALEGCIRARRNRAEGSYGH